MEGRFARCGINCKFYQATKNANTNCTCCNLGDLLLLRINYK